MQKSINPFYAARGSQASVARAAEPPRPRPVLARLPVAPITGSPVPHLTSLYHNPEAGNYGSRSYPGNCGGNLIRDLLRFYGATNCYDPMTGSGTARDVCKEMGIYCWSGDIRTGFDACTQTQFHESFSFAWLHPPYYRQKLYSEDPRCLSRAPTFEAFLERYRLLIEATARAVMPGGKLAILMGDYQDRDYGFLPLVFWTKYLAFKLGLKQCATDIIRFSHGASSGRKVYRSSFIPGLHDVCVVFEKQNQEGQP